MRLVAGRKAQKLRERLIEFLAEQLGVSRDAITEDTSLVDFAADSLDMIELVMELEEESNDG